jgi:hypothetical protein
MAEEAVSNSKTVQSAADDFGRLAIPGFEVALKRFRREDSKFYAERIKIEQQPLQVVFAAFEDGIAKYVLVFFTITDDTGSRMVVTSKRESCPGSACPSSETNEITVLGEHAAISRQSQNNHAAVGSDAVAATRQLISIEIANRPDIVGPPISILVISRAGPKWIEKGRCED